MTHKAISKTVDAFEGLTPNEREIKLLESKIEHSRAIISLEQNTIVGAQNRIELLKGK